MKRYCVMVFLSVIFLWTCLGSVALAGPAANFSISPVIPDNQLNQSASYFDIEMEPGDTQTLEVILSNHSDKEIVVSQSVNTAITNSNGVVEYGPNDREHDNTLTHSFADIATAEDEITLAPESSQTVSIEIALPEEPFEGVLLGGIYFVEKNAEGDEEESQQGVAIRHEIAYVIGIRIDVGNTSNIQPELQLNDVQPTQINYRNAVTANIQNIKPAAIRKLTIDAKIYKEGSKEALREVKKEDMRMAPNSNFDFPISWEEEEFEDGTYVLELTAMANGKRWDWTETFEIGNSKELNEEAIVKKAEIDYTTVGIVTFVSGGALTWILKRRQKKVG